MNNFGNAEECLQSIVNERDILIIQDIDGVCIPLVKDPLNRKINSLYVNSVSKLDGQFYVLTCGEHEGRRGVNRIIEASFKNKQKISSEGIYLPGLAGCGVEYQDRFGNIKILGLSNDEINFLKDAPGKMKILLRKKLKILFANISEKRLNELLNVAICDTRFTPTINLNEILDLAQNDLNITIKLQLIMKEIMDELINSTRETDLKDSFYLHIMPNIGTKDGKELMKIATDSDRGTTDIQFIINGALKEAGLLVLLNHFIKNKSGNFPFGIDFNVRNAPKEREDLINLCIQKISPNEMPLLIGVGDTVTSEWSPKEKQWNRGGSDRGFLTLIQEIGKRYKKENKVIFVNSGNNQVSRPSISNESMEGISDKEDLLKFNAAMLNGPDEYIKWFEKLSNQRFIKDFKN